MASPHLLLFSLGPVQDFIAAARRCQDLWFGSYMLSELSRAAAEAVENVCGAEALIFPGKLQDGAAVANKILARAADASQAERAAQAAAVKISERLHEMADDAWPHKGTRYFDHSRARKQLDELMEMFWVSAPEEPSYALARDRVETLLAARKATKDWPSQASSVGARGVPKSSLDGVRESVIHAMAYDSLSTEELRRQFGIKQGKEQLCGVALLKRRGVQVDDPRWRRPAFHSTSHMAAAPLLVRLDTAAASDFARWCGSDEIRTGAQGHATRVRPPAALRGYVRDVPASVPRTFDQREDRGRDGVVFFEDRLGPDVLGVARAADLAKAQRRLKALLGGIIPVPYYAMLQADGDHMGDAISRLAGGDDGWARHQEFSRRLDGFALAARGIVEDHGGSLIYAGGDDVLALLPLHTALACADALRIDFSERMGQGLTFSVGVALVHHLTPIDRARELAKQAERAAKDDAGRDALAVVMDKRSGVTLTVHDKWSADLRGRLDGWAATLHAEGLPNGVAYELERMLGTFDGARGATAADREAIEALTRQIIARKRENRGRGELDDAVIQRLHDRFTQASNPKRAVERLSHELQIARLLLRSYDVAWNLLARPEGGEHA